MATSIQALVSNVKNWISAIAVSAGIADASKVPLTNSSGILDNSFINWGSPSAIGATTPNTASFSTLTITGSVTYAPYSWELKQSQSSFGANAVRTRFRNDFTATLGDFLYLGATGNASNTAKTAIVCSTLLGIQFGLGTDLADSLSATWATITSTGLNNTPIGATTASTIKGTTGSFSSTLSVSDALTVSKSVAGLFRQTFRNTDTSTSRRSDIFIATGAGTEGIFIGSQPSGAYIDNRSGASLYFQTSGSSFLSIDASGNLISTATTGSTNTTQGAIVANSIGIAANANIGGNLAVTGTLKVGSGGSTITRVLLASSSALDTVSVGAQTSTTITVTVTGATIGDQVNVNASSATPNTNFSLHGYVSAANTVTVVAYNRAATSQSFSGNVKVSVIG
jgi:hypothetical protein